MTSSWNPGWLTSAKRVTVWDQLPRRDTWYTIDGVLKVHLGLNGLNRVGDYDVPLAWNSVVSKHLVIWAAQTWEGHKTQAQQSLRLWGVPEYLNLSDLDLEAAYNPGPATDCSQQSNLQLKQCRQGEHTRRERGQTQCGQDTASTCQCYLSAASLPPHSRTEQVSLKKFHHCHRVSRQKSDTEETRKQKKLKQREPPWKWQVQWIKTL